MIDERLEELAALYAFDLLEGAELTQFQAALERDPALQTLVREFRSASTSLAHAAAVPPPPTLRDRVLASVADRAPSAELDADNVIRPPASAFGRVAPWGIAACFAVIAAWTGQRYMAARNETLLLRDQQALADVALKSTQQQLEAERIVVRRQVQDLEQQIAGTSAQLTDTRTQLATATQQLSEKDRQLNDTRTQLADARTRVSDRELQVAQLTQRIDALTGASAEIGRQLGEAKERIAKLTEEMKTERDLANFKITTLASLLKNNPQALAVAVWDPAQQQGVLKVEKLPALLPNQDYQLWVVDPQYPNPVDGGVFTVDPATGERRVTFKPKQPVAAVAAFAVTLERKGGVPKAEGPFVLLGK